MWIDVRIPYGLNNSLAQAYNRVLEESTAEWVLFLDHDVFLCNPLWYDMCLNAIGQMKKDSRAACLTCVCGGERHRRSMRDGKAISDNIEHHIRESILHYQHYRCSLEQINVYAAGYFLLLNRKIAQRIGFQQQNHTVNNIDADFGTRLMAEGYHIYLMRGLYIYHRRGMKHLVKEFRK